MLILGILLQIINKVKVTHQGQGHIKVKVKISTSFKFYVKFYLFPHIYFFVCGCCSHIYFFVCASSSLIRSWSHIEGQGSNQCQSKNIYIPFNFMWPILLNEWVVCIQMKCILVSQASVILSRGYTSQHAPVQRVWCRGVGWCRGRCGVEGVPIHGGLCLGVWTGRYPP